MKVVFANNLSNKFDEQLFEHLSLELNKKIKIEQLKTENSLFFIKTINSEFSNSNDQLAIIFSDYGIAEFIYACKMPNIIAALCSDEESSIMTKRHNNANVLIIGLEIVGQELAKTIVKNFIETPYDGGRHQIRIDMLKKLLKESK